jgi:hypothetical protein
MADVTGTYYNNEGFIGYGTELLVGDGASPEGFDAVAYVMNIQFGAMTTEVIKKTHLRSPNRHEEKLLALRDSGPFTMELTWVPTHESQNRVGGGTGSFASGGLLAKWISGVTTNFKVRLSDGSPATDVPFRGGVTKWQPGSLSGNALVNLTVEVTPVGDFSADLP